MPLVVTQMFSLETKTLVPGVDSGDVCIHLADCSEILPPHSSQVPFELAPAAGRVADPIKLIREQFSHMPDNNLQCRKSIEEPACEQPQHVQATLSVPTPASTAHLKDQNGTWSA